jgi:hypothetical protein
MEFFLTGLSIGLLVAWYVHRAHMDNRPKIWSAERGYRLIQCEEENARLMEALEEIDGRLTNLQPIIANGLLSEDQLRFIDAHVDPCIDIARAALGDQFTTSPKPTSATAIRPQMHSRASPYLSGGVTIWPPCRIAPLRFPRTP